MANCKQCGSPLTKGNIRFVRKPGKRPFRIHRRCPQVHSEAIQTVELVGNVESTGNTLQRPQVSTGDPLVAEVMLEHLDPPKYRYFITRAMAEKIQRAIKGAQVGITVEVIPVPEYLLEADCEAFTDYVEIQMKGGMNHEHD